ncbi:MAG TPA: asparagine synthase (glutamine-hydrolyzing) [Terriglobales bacterium]
MCGICGIYYTDNDPRVDSAVLTAMNARIAHRGPDDEGFFVEGNVGLAMRRLSIVDVQTGRQPIANEDENLWLVYNGEIYNHRELRADLQARGHRYRTRSDTETILHLYEEYGTDCVNHLRGMFAFAIWDKLARRLFIARDRLGIKPLYYWHNNGTFLFASEIKSILSYPGVQPTFNRSTLAEYLAFGYVTGPETMFSGVHNLLPGHTLKLGEDDNLAIHQYWDLPIADVGTSRPKAFYVGKYREMLEESVSSHLMSDVPLGVFLSGGLDSSVIAALTAKISGRQIETFSVGYAESAFSELPSARQVAEHIGSSHHEVRIGREGFFEVLPQLIWYEDEPIAWPSSVSLYSVAKLARESVKVVLTGEGSDETLAGYARYPWTLRNVQMDSVYRALTPALIRGLVRKGIDRSPLPAGIHRKLAHTFLARNGGEWSSFYFDNFYSAFSAKDQSLMLNGQVSSTGDAYAGPLRYWDKSTGDLLHRLLYVDIKTYLVELLMKQDQMSMAASLESRVPFLDHKLVEFTAEIPVAYSINGLTGKSILKAAASDLLPASIIHRRKMGFPTPWASWLAAELPNIESILLSQRARSRGLFKDEAIRALLAEHRAGHRDHSTRIWRLLNLELWQRVFIDGGEATPRGDTSTFARFVHTMS